MRFLQESRSIKLCADLDQLVSVDLNWSAYEKNEISQLKSSFGKLELDYKELKHQQKQMNIRLRKLEEVVNVAQIEIEFRVDGVSSWQRIATYKSREVSVKITHFIINY